jgi:hypothetical protein
MYPGWLPGYREGYRDRRTSLSAMPKINWLLPDDRQQREGAME